MAGLILPPPICDVYGVVADMIPTIAPGADPQEIQQSIPLVQKLFSLCEQAKTNPTAEKVFVALFQSLIEFEPTSFSIASQDPLNQLQSV